MNRTFIVRSMALEAIDVISIELVPRDGAPVARWSPGAHVDLRLAGGVVRQYSLCGNVADHYSYRVAVLREVASRGGSAYVHATLRPGEEVEVGEPRNNFPLLPARRYRFVAGGIGITPFLPMLAELQASGASWDLLYGGKTAGHMAFRTALSAYGDRVTIRPQDVYGLLDLETWLIDVDEGTVVYACGPEPLLLAMESFAERWPPDVLRLERFAARGKLHQKSRRTEAATVVCARSGLRVEVAPGQSVLYALRAAGVVVETSCEEGICGTCETKVLAGTPEHRDSILSPKEQSAGTQMMVCVSGVASDELVVDL